MLGVNESFFIGFTIRIVERIEVLSVTALSVDDDGFHVKSFVINSIKTIIQQGLEGLVIQETFPHGTCLLPHPI